MKLLALTRFGPEGGSSRVRFYEYAPWLAQAGIQFEFQALLSPRYLQQLYATKTRSLPELLEDYLKRAKHLISASQYDIWWIEKELWPYAPYFLEKCFTRKSPVKIYDYDDAVFHTYDRSPSAITRTVLGRKIDQVMGAADIVFAGNTYIGARAIAAGAAQVELLPSVVDLSRYPLVKRAGPSVQKPDNRPIIGWVGSPSTRIELTSISSTLERIVKRTNCRFVTVGDGGTTLLFDGHESKSWTYEGEVAQLHDFDIGIMPLRDLEFQRGKCGYKLIQYMACSKPVVASPVGVNCQIVKHGINGYLASTEKEWESRLVELLDDVKLRRQIGINGRATIETEYSFQVTGPKVAQLMFDAVKLRKESAPRNLSRSR